MFRSTRCTGLSWCMGRKYCDECYRQSICHIQIPCLKQKGYECADVMHSSLSVRCYRMLTTFLRYHFIFFLTEKLIARVEYSIIIPILLQADCNHNVTKMLCFYIFKKSWRLHRAWVIHKAWVIHITTRKGEIKTVPVLNNDTGIHW